LPQPTAAEESWAGIQKQTIGYVARNTWIDQHRGIRTVIRGPAGAVIAHPGQGAADVNAKKSSSKPTKPILLSGGNPQIPKGDGDAPVQAYIDAMPDWKQDVGRRLDNLIVDVVPRVQKAVRWNSPFYGVEGKGWFLSYHCFTRYVKITFLNGASLDPLPPEPSKDPGTRYAHIHEDGTIDEGQMKDWIRQGAALPGWDGF
jgi:hypothetical protein